MASGEKTGAGGIGGHGPSFPNSTQRGTNTSFAPIPGQIAPISGSQVDSNGSFDVTAAPKAKDAPFSGDTLKEILSTLGMIVSGGIGLPIGLATGLIGAKDGHLGSTIGLVKDVAGGIFDGGGTGGPGPGPGPGTTPGTGTGSGGTTIGPNPPLGQPQQADAGGSDAGGDGTSGPATGPVSTPSTGTDPYTSTGLGPGGTGNAPIGAASGDTLGPGGLSGGESPGLSQPTQGPAYAGPGEAGPFGAQGADTLTPGGLTGGESTGLSGPTQGPAYSGPGEQGPFGAPSGDTLAPGGLTGGELGPLTSPDISNTPVANVSATGSDILIGNPGADLLNTGGNDGSDPGSIGGDTGGYGQDQGGGFEGGGDGFFHKGGKVRGKGKTDKTITAQTGEYVIRGDAVNKYGEEIFDKLNKGHIDPKHIHSVLDRIGAGNKDWGHTASR